MSWAVLQVGMDKILCTKKGAMEFLNSSAFYSLKSGSIMVETVELLRASNLQGTAFVGNLPGI